MSVTNQTQYSQFNPEPVTLRTPEGISTNDVRFLEVELYCTTPSPPNLPRSSTNASYPNPSPLPARNYNGSSYFPPSCPPPTHKCRFPPPKPSSARHANLNPHASGRPRPHLQPHLRHPPSDHHHAERLDLAVHLVLRPLLPRLVFSRRLRPARPERLRVRSQLDLRSHQRQPANVPRH